MANFLKYGLMAGIIYSVYALILQLTGSDLRFNTTLIFVIMLVFPVIFMVMAVKSERSLQEGLISFGEALKTSFLTYLIFIIIAVVVGQLLIQMYSADDWNRFVDVQRDLQTSMLDMAGMDQIMIDEAREQITKEALQEQISGISGILVGVLGDRKSVV